MIVVNWNTCDLLQECLERASIAAKKIDHEIIIVDNGSTDGSIEMVRSSLPSIHLIENTENLGFAKAVNQGIKASSGELVVLVNSDIFMSSNSLVQLVKHLDENPEVAAVGPQLVDRNGHLQYSAGFAPSPLSALKQLIGIHALFGGRSRGVYARSKSTRKVLHVDWLSAACLVIRMETIKVVGMFDESKFMYAEDTEYGLRLSDSGWKLYLLPWVRVLHLGGASSSNLSETQLLWLGGMFRVAAGRLSRPTYTLFGALLGTAYLERYLLICIANIIMKCDPGEGVVSADESLLYARTAFKLCFRRTDYASVYCKELEERLRKE
jgi:GT2 family glycosyltransferase